MCFHWILAYHKDHHSLSSPYVGPLSAVINSFGVSHHLTPMTLKSTSQCWEFTYQTTLIILLNVFVDAPYVDVWRSNRDLPQDCSADGCISFLSSDERSSAQPVNHHEVVQFTVIRGRDKVDDVTSVVESFDLYRPFEALESLSTGSCHSTITWTILADRTTTTYGHFGISGIRCPMKLSRPSLAVGLLPASITATLSSLECQNQISPNCNE